MRNTLRDFKTRALVRPGVRQEYEELKEEFELLDEILKARTEAGLSQAELVRKQLLEAFRNEYETYW